MIITLLYCFAGVLTALIGARWLGQHYTKYKQNYSGYDASFDHSWWIARYAVGLALCSAAWPLGLVIFACIRQFKYGHTREPSPVKLKRENATLEEDNIALKKQLADITDKHDKLVGQLHEANQIIVASYPLTTVSLTKPQAPQVVGETH